MKSWAARAVEFVTAAALVLSLSGCTGDGADVTDDQAADAQLSSPNEPAVIAAAPTNLGFEESAEGGAAPGWYRIGSDSSPYEVSRDETVKRTGKASGRASRPGEGATAGWQQGYRPEALAGRRVVVRGWIKTEDVPACRTCETAGMNQAQAVSAGEAGAWLNLFTHPRHQPGAAQQDTVQATWRTPHVTGTTDWTLFEAELPVPENAEEVYLAAILWGTGTAWFDDVELEVIE